jgi:hypothetical protein
MEISFAKYGKANASWPGREQTKAVAMCLLWLKRGYRCDSGGMFNVCVHLAKGFLGQSTSPAVVAIAPCSENMDMGKWARGTFSLLASTCMASMPPLKAHRYKISCENIGASLGREAKQGAGRKVAWFWGVGDMKIWVTLAI